MFVLIRVPIALCVGISVYILAALLTTTSGMESAFQPVTGAIISGLSIVAVIFLGLPLLIPAWWERWRSVWLVPTLMNALAAILFCLSWLPSLRVTVIDPDNDVAHLSFSPTLFISAWFIMLSALVWHPLIGMTRTGKWA